MNLYLLNIPDRLFYKIVGYCTRDIQGSTACKSMYKLKYIFKIIYCVVGLAILATIIGLLRCDTANGLHLSDTCQRNTIIAMLVAIIFNAVISVAYCVVYCCRATDAYQEVEADDSSSRTSVDTTQLNIPLNIVTYAE